MIDIEQIAQMLRETDGPTVHGAGSLHDMAADALARLDAALAPRRWTQEMSDAWHLNLPDLNKAFEALRVAACRRTR